MVFLAASAVAYGFHPEYSYYGFHPEYSYMVSSVPKSEYRASASFNLYRRRRSRLVRNSKVPFIVMLTSFLLIVLSAYFIMPQNSATRLFLWSSALKIWVLSLYRWSCKVRRMLREIKMLSISDGIVRRHQKVMHTYDRKKKTRQSL